jgi:subtilase family serine protease
MITTPCEGPRGNDTNRGALLCVHCLAEARSRTAAIITGLVLLTTGIAAQAQPARAVAGVSGAAGRATAGTATTTATTTNDQVIVRGGTRRLTGVQAAATPPSGYSPADLRSAYNLVPAAASGGTGATVAIIVQYDDPQAADLAIYRAQYGLPACTTANGCFAKVNEDGQASPLPPAAPAPGQFYDPEASATPIDLDMVSAICPDCHIRVVETSSDLPNDLGTAVDSAVSLGIKYVIIGYALDFSPTPATDAGYFDHPGVAIVAPAGDSGFPLYNERGAYPASSPFVTAVGGTTLTRASNARGWTETVWGPPTTTNGLLATGSVCATYYGKPSWETDGGCGLHGGGQRAGRLGHLQRAGPAARGRLHPGAV